MKRKLQLLLFALMLTVSFAHAQKTDVWDLGGVALDPSLYNNNLTVATINSWYPTTTAGTSGVTLPNTTTLTLTAGVLTLTTGSSDRLYVAAANANVNNITRYTTGSIGTTDTNYTSRYYCNGAANNATSVAAATTRFFTLTLNTDDEVTIVASTESAGNSLSVSNLTTGTQTETLPVTISGAGITLAKFVAKDAGTFKIVSLVGKGNYYRIYRKPVTPVTLTGNLDVSAALGIPSGYSVLFTNNFTGKTYSAPVVTGTYSVTIPSGFTYKMNLVNASGYIISNGETFTVVDATTVTHDISILKIDLYTVSGSVTGLGTKISSAALTYTPSVVKTFVPKPVINTTTSTYTVDLEASTQYIITATGVNDYEILANTITIPASNTTADIAFTAKPVYPITINTTGLDATQLSNLKLSFTNLNESGYVYNFNSVSGITLRDGTYSVAYSGLDNYPVDCGTISNLKVTGAATSKTIDFKPLTVWSFEDRTISTTTSAGYKGILATGTVSNRIANGDLTAKTGATIKIPVKNIGDKVLITYYYAANFSIEGGTAITTASNSTTIFENVEYTYTGTETTPGYVTITLGGSALTTYFTNIQIGGGSITYSPVITVGTGKNYTTINEALTAVAFMNRTSAQRVTIMIDPGNYEEMIDITQPNVTLKNAATTPNINLLNKGVDIDAGAVRITSYYGLGYNYYSMKNNQKWDADVLRVNKENGSQPYTNVSGSTNNSYWNATLIVSAKGFIAEDIIIENSYNQYISLKESQDVVELASGNKGVRATTYKSTAVQNKSFVERAAAIAIKDNIDKVVLNKCRVVGRQDSFFGGKGARVVVYKGVMMGATDYIFGGMNAVFYKTDLAMNTSDVTSDVSYITAAQQTTGRGYLMYECKVTSAAPITETASSDGSKPGYFGRPWAANTSEVVFYNTTIETSTYPANSGQSLIVSLGWNNSLSGDSPKMYEYGTVEKSGVYSTSRAAWATLLSSPTLTDGTPITTFNFTKGTDNWDPLPQLISSETLGIKRYQANSSSVTVTAYKNNVAVSNVVSNTKVCVYSLTGALIKSFATDTDTTFNLNSGIWIVVVKSADGQKAVKVITY
jgi:exo-poly-alpha-galacturonosidase